MSITFKTTDLFLAAVLEVSGFPLESIHQENPQKSFLFERKEGFQDTVDAYWNHKLAIPDARALGEAYKSIKLRMKMDISLAP